MKTELLLSFFLLAFAPNVLAFEDTSSNVLKRVNSLEGKLTFVNKTDCPVQIMEENFAQHATLVGQFPTENILPGKKTNIKFNVDKGLYASGDISTELECRLTGLLKSNNPVWGLFFSKNTLKAQFSSEAACRLNLSAVADFSRGIMPTASVNYKIIAHAGEHKVIDPFFTTNSRKNFVAFGDIDIHRKTNISLAVGGRVDSNSYPENMEGRNPRPNGLKVSDTVVSSRRFWWFAKCRNCD